MHWLRDEQMRERASAAVTGSGVEMGTERSKGPEGETRGEEEGKEARGEGEGGEGAEEERTKKEKGRKREEGRGYEGRRQS